MRIVLNYASTDIAAHSQSPHSSFPGLAWDGERESEAAFLPELGRSKRNRHYGAMDSLFRFPTARRDDPDVKAWFVHGDPLRGLVEPWFDRLRACGPDVRTLIHDGRPTACAGDAAFAYVDAHTQHASIGFFFGAFLDDPATILDGAGKRMRHVKLRIDRMPDEAVLVDLIIAAYRDIRRRLDAS